MCVGRRIECGVTAQLIDTTTGYHLWLERYDGRLADIFALQDEIVQKSVTTLKLQLSLREQGYIARKRTDNLEAYDAFLQGVEYLFRYTKEDNLRARQMFEKAVALDSKYTHAYTYLSATYLREWGLRWSADPKNLERALALAQQALALDGSLPAAHSRLGEVYGAKQQYDQAIAAGERAIALDPNHADSYGVQAGVLNGAGRPEEALRAAQQAMRLNPHYSHYYASVLGRAYLLTGRYAEAITTLKEAISRNPNEPGSHTNLALSYLLQWGSQQSLDPQILTQALAEAQQVVALNDSVPWGHATLGGVYLSQKQYELAIAEMERAIALDPNWATSYAVLAEILGWMGRTEESLQMVEQALRRKPGVVDEHLGSIGAAYYLAGKPGEAIAPLKQFTTRYPNHVLPHLDLASAYSELGNDAEARAEAAEVLRLNPTYSLEVARQRSPLKDQARLEYELAILRKAELK